MSAGVIRLEATKGLPDDALLRHVLGETRPASAHVRRHLGVGVEVLEYDVQAYALAERHAADTASAKRGGKPPSLGVSWLFAGGPDTDDVHREESTIPADAPATLQEGRPWTLDDCRDFARECVGLLREAMPSGKWVAALHLDEKAVHVQVEQPAVLEDGLDERERPVYRVGNAGIRESLVRLAPDFAKENERIRQKFREREDAAVARDAATVAAGKKPKKRRKFVDRGADHMYLTAEAQMRLVHDVYALRMGRLGIERGKGGKRQHHERVDREKGMEAKHRALERDVEAAERALEVARTKHSDFRSDIAARDRAVMERESVVDRRDAELAPREQAVQGREEVLAEDEMRLGVNQIGLEVNQIRLGKNQDQLKTDRAAARTRSTELEEWARGLDERETAVQGREEVLAEDEMRLGVNQIRLEVDQIRLGKNQDQLKTDRAAVRTRSTEFEEWARGLDERETAVQGREEVLATDRAAVRSRSTELEVRARGVDERETAVQGREEVLATDRAAVRSQSTELDERARGLGEQDAAQDRRQVEQDRCAGELREREEAVQGLEDVLRAGQAALETDQGQLEKDGAAVRSQSTELDERARGVEERETAVQAREEALAADQKQLEVGARELQEGQAGLRTRTRELDERARGLGEQDAAQDRRQVDQGQRDVGLDARESDVAAQAAAVLRQVEDVQRRDREVATLERRAKRWGRQIQRGFRAWRRLRARVRGLRDREHKVVGLEKREGVAAEVAGAATARHEEADVRERKLGEHAQELVAFRGGLEQREAAVGEERAKAAADRKAAGVDRQRAEAARDHDAVLERVLAAGRRVIEIWTVRGDERAKALRAFDHDTAAALRGPVLALPPGPAQVRERARDETKGRDDGPGVR